MTNAATIPRVGTPPHRVRQIAVPPGARALSTLGQIDYEDAFLVDVGAVERYTAEQWARAFLEDASESVRRTLRMGWAGIGLKLGASRSGCFVLGWEIRRNTTEFLLLGADSHTAMAGELLFMRQEHTLLYATFVQYGGNAGRLVWAVVEPVHIPVVRRVLEEASSRLRP